MFCSKVIYAFETGLCFSIYQVNVNYLKIPYLVLLVLFTLTSYTLTSYTFFIDIFSIMVGEKRTGNLGPKLQAYPEELIRQRRGHDGHTEYLIRWSILSLDDSVENTTHAASAENKMDNILMWMSAEEVYANCPTLLGKRKPEGQRVKEEKSPSTFPSDVTVDEASLHEMKADVRNLVQRANRQMARTSGPESSILNTVHVLSAYASIGSLTGVFKETGALDLLMKMLCNEEKQIRRSAGKMLRALASHDAGEVAD